MRISFSVHAVLLIQPIAPILHSVGTGIAGCPMDLWARRSDAAATAAGIDLTQYTFRSYLLPTEPPDCAWAGVAFVDTCKVSNAPRCLSWVRGFQPGRAWVHELGHNIGMNHAAVDYDNDGGSRGTQPSLTMQLMTLCAVACDCTMQPSHCAWMPACCHHCVCMVLCLLVS